MIIIMIVVACVSYLFGSCPYGLILVKLLKNKDIRKIGSHNIGATNVLRAGYPLLALVTLICDALKGVLVVFLATLVARIYGYDEIMLVSVTAICCVIGHILPVWINFKGGKGVATTLGIIIYVDPFLGLATIFVWLLTAFITKYSSLSAIMAFICLPIFAFIINIKLFIMTLVLSCIILYKHEDNFIRLINNNEDKIKILKKKFKE